MRRQIKKAAAFLLACAMVFSTVQTPVWAAVSQSEVPAVKAGEFPGTPGEVAKKDKVYALNNTLTMTTEEGATVTQFQNNKGTADDIKVDASAAGAKFAPRDAVYGDTQINAGTILYVPVAANEDGAVLTAKVSGGTGALQIKGTDYAPTTSSPAVVELPASSTAEYCAINVTAQTYLNEISVTYKEAEVPFPGEPGTVAKTDKTYTLNTSLPMEDEAGNAVTQLQGKKGTADDIKVDASAGKFAPRSDDTQITAGTILYVPVAANTKGAAITVTTSGGTAEAAIDGTAYSFTTSTPAVKELVASSTAKYCEIKVTAQSYLKEITVAYKDNEAAFPGVPEGVQAKDVAYTLNTSMALTDMNGNAVTQIQNGKGIACEDIKVDATAGKFSPRSGDTQINPGTILYVPVAPDAKGATIQVSGNNNGNLPLTWNGKAISVGSETVFETPAEAAYFALEFGGTTGSCYATGITIDYKSDDAYATKTVTVGAGGTYATIGAALKENTSSAKNRLVLSIAPGKYNERVLVEDPYVTFKNADPSKGEVVIHERYYSSNKRKANGDYDPQDEYDLGTAECGTVIVKSTATGFIAENITFQNDYNISYTTKKDTQTPAVALNTRADKVELKNCKILGRQDTFYPQGAGCRVVLTDCTIEGTVDFIFGDADAFFEDCTIKMTTFTGRDSGYFVAPNTKKGNTGLVFYNCKVQADSSYTNAEKVSLGRPWQTECESTLDAAGNMTSYDSNTKKKGYENLSSAATFIECTMSDNIKASRFSSWTRKLHKEDGTTETVVVSYDKDVRFKEINTRKTDGSLLAKPATLTPSTTTFETGLTAADVDSRLASIKKTMNIGPGTTWDSTEEVVVKTVAKPALTGAEGLVYDGTAKSVSVAANAAYTVSGTTSATNAGTYTVVVALKDTKTTTWDDGTIDNLEFTWTIAKADQTVTAAVNPATVEAGQTAAVEVTGAKTAVTYSVSDETIATVAADGTVTAKAPGTATITVTAAADANYNAATATADVIVTKKAPVKVEKPALDQTSFVYDGTEKAVTVAANEAYTVSGTTKATNAGTYTVTVTLKDTEANVWADGTTDPVELTWTIAKADQTLTAAVEPETVEAGQTAKVSVTGAKTAVTYSVSDETIATVAEDGTVTAKAAGTVTITATAAADENYNAATAKAELTVTKKAPVKVEKPALDKTSFVYDGTEKSVTVAANEAYTVSGTTKATNAGTYTVTVTLKDTEANVWADGTTDPVELTWTIAKADQTLTAAVEPETVEAGQTAKVSVTGAKTAVTYSVSDETIATVAEDGTVTAKAAGTVTIKATAAADENYNGASTEVTVTVTAKKVEKPALETAEFVYDGTEKSVTIAESDAYTVSGTTKATNAGTYTATVTLKDTNVAVWADGTTDPVELTWTIAKADQPLDVQASAESVVVGSKVQISAYGSVGTVTYALDNEEIASIDEDGILTTKKVGEVIVTVTASGDDNTNEATDSVTVVVTEKEAEAVEKPSLTGTTSFVYDGTEKSVTAPAETETYTVSGTTKATNAGTYTVTATLKDTSAYKWADGTVAPVEMTWTIAKADQKITVTTSAPSVEEGKTMAITVKDAKGSVSYSVADPEIASVDNDGVVTGKKAGSTVVTVTAEETANYKAATATVTVNVTAPIKVEPEKPSVVLKRPVMKKCLNKGTYVSVRWNKVAKASGYVVYRKTSTKGVWKKVATVKSGSKLYWYDKTVKNGNYYIYNVKAYNGKTYSKMASKNASIYFLTKNKLSKVKKSGSKNLAVTWTKNKKAAGYRIQYATNKSFKSPKYKTIKGNKVSGTITSLKKGKTYYVRVQSYKKYNGVTYYSAWTTAKKIKR